MSSRVTPPFELDGVVIVLIGRSGSGKTTFIKHLTGREDLETDALDHCTDKVQAYSWTFQGKEITLVDTPGLRADTTHDQSVISDIKQVCKGRQPAFVCCHSIRDPRFDRLAKDSYKAVKDVCGQPSNVAIVTTHWDREESRTYQAQRHRHEKLREDVLKKWIDKGNEIHQSDDSPAAAREIVFSLLQNEVRVRRVKEEIDQEKKNGLTHEKAVQIAQDNRKARLKRRTLSPSDRSEVEAEVRILNSYEVKNHWSLSFFSLR
ncbi:P-loop containing nucleoside triphosphate hydrolase protein [Serendipita vermifera]|nr:P-loop containing nucleoside triphosphate hydrolase protein [Serendipita vermifera]